MLLTLHMVLESVMKSAAAEKEQGGSCMAPSILHVKWDIWTIINQFRLIYIPELPPLVISMSPVSVLLHLQ